MYAWQFLAFHFHIRKSESQDINGVAFLNHRYFYVNHRTAFRCGLFLVQIALSPIEDRYLSSLDQHWPQFTVSLVHHTLTSFNLAHPWKRPSQECELSLVQFPLQSCRSASCRFLLKAR